MYKKLLIDGDILVYKCAFAVEETMSMFQKADGSKVGIENIREARKLQGDDCIVMSRIVPPEKDAIDALHSSVMRLIASIPAEEYEIVLSVSDAEVNKRVKISKQLPYKADRPPKPFHYQALRKELIANFNTIEVTEGEADDYLGANQTSETIIASVDKDLLQIPGDHFNITDSSIISVSEIGRLDIDESNKLTGDGFIWFCAQCLLGDRTDAIKGIPYLRKAKVHKLLSGAKTKRQAWERVEKEYQDNVRVPLFYMNLTESESEARRRFLKETAQLVWIAHSDDDYYLPNIDGERII